MSMFRQVNEAEGRLEATKYNAKYMEVSAKSGMNIDNLFNGIIQDIIKSKDNKINYDGGGGIKSKSIYNNNKDTNIININNNNNNNNIYANNMDNENGLEYDNSSYYLKSKIPENKNDNNDYVNNINKFYTTNNQKEYQNSYFFSNNKNNKCQIF